jgi:hypothetical protein
MIENSLHFLHKKDDEYLTESFSDRIGSNRDGISVTEFKEILFGFGRLSQNQNFACDLFEKCKKKMKQRQPGISENEMVIRKL